MLFCSTSADIAAEASVCVLQVLRVVSLVEIFHEMEKTRDGVREAARVRLTVTQRLVPMRSMSAKQ